MIDREQLEAASEAYYAYCGADWNDLDPKAQTHYRTRMQLGLDAFVASIWRPISSVPRDGSAVLLFLYMEGRGDYVWLDRWTAGTRRTGAGVWPHTPVRRTGLPCPHRPRIHKRESRKGLRGLMRLMRCSVSRSH
ncbi:hypothetical protein [Acetobacter aceti]|uniref:Uncharacterized protein n=1 Tax=Acetobacter aceti TaxID=435 RepID=A0A6S6PLR0_ACEAC|nr:hypothetical protein [Acetobacter aceti]BCI66154.1 hypothetical protein AAJCM20276_07780 [Acetobacter aceti]